MSGHCWLAMRRLLTATAVATVLLAGPALANCTGRSKGSECNSFGGTADGFSGCAVETRDGWYTINISQYGSSSIKKICSKNPPSGYCGCSDFGIY